MDMPTLSALDVLVLDCQATAAAPRGHLLEIGWAVAGSRATPAQARLIALPAGTRVPPAVTRITGISESMLSGAPDATHAWAAFAAEAARFDAPARTVIHYARFERKFLTSPAAGSLHLDIVCTHDIATRLLPDLPRRSLRALAGYFGAAVGTLRRSAEHVDATAFVWRELVALLAREGVTTWSELRRFLDAPVDSRKRSRRVYPMPRDQRLALPEDPGVYRMLRTNGDVLYVGKATCLRERVNSHFRHQRGVHERALEMLSQARAISFEVAGSALEAALLEADEIKRRRPPYNVALQVDDRTVWFASPDLVERSLRPSERCAVGPFPSAETLDQFAALVRGRRAALGTGRWAPDSATFSLGLNRFNAVLEAITRTRADRSSSLLGLGAWLWRQGRRDRDLGDDDDVDRSRIWTVELVQMSLEWLVIRAALARRRASWFTQLMQASLVWTEPGARTARLLEIDDGEILRCGAAEGTTPPVPRGHQRSAARRRDAITLDRFDRLRVLTTELKRLSASHTDVAVRFGAAPALAGARLAAALSWL